MPSPPKIKLAGTLKGSAMSRTEATAGCRIQGANLGPGLWVLKPRRAHPAPTEHLCITLTVLPSFLKENVSLIKEINELRRELKLTRSQIYDLESALKVSKKTRTQEVPESGNATGGGHRDQDSETAMSRSPFGFFQHKVTSTHGASVSPRHAPALQRI